MLSEGRLDELTALVPLLEESGAARTRALLAVPELIAEVRRLRDGIEGLTKWDAEQPWVRKSELAGLIHPLNFPKVVDQLEAEEAADLLNEGSTDDDDR